ncbi:hypothetical protein FJY94_09190, partial [Candidatus Kaiserbacteria bacterium]|nr:hypothetical protein [Candidatus Kaiserbacteria bacterium]
MTQIKEDGTINYSDLIPLAARVLFKSDATLAVNVTIPDSSGLNVTNREGNAITELSATVLIDADDSNNVVTATLTKEGVVPFSYQVTGLDPNATYTVWVDGAAYDGDQWLQFNYSAGGGTLTFSGTPSSPADLGVRTVTLRGTDAAGNTTDSSFYLKVSNPATGVTTPTLALAVDTGSSASDKITSNGALTVSGAETGATVEYSTNGSSWSSSFTPVEGSNTVYVRQTDILGNIRQASSAFTFTLDTLAPTATITLSDTALKFVDTATVTVTFSEKVTGFDASGLTVENGTLTAMTSSDNITWTGTFTPKANIKDADNVISLATTTYYTDVAGNPGAVATSDNYAVDTEATINFVGTPKDVPYAVEKFLDFVQDIPSTIPSGATYVASVIESDGTIHLFDTNSDGLPDSFVSNWLEDGQEMTATGSIDVTSAGTVMWLEDGTTRTETGRLALDTNGNIVGFFMLKEGTDTTGGQTSGSYLKGDPSKGVVIFMIDLPDGVTGKGSTGKVVVEVDGGQ